MPNFFAHEMLKQEVISRAARAAAHLAKERSLSLSAEELNQLAQVLERAAGVPPDFALGQVALPCFALAKTFRLAPQELANLIAADINQQCLTEQESAESKAAAGTMSSAHTFGNPSLIAKATPAGGFLNIHANFGRLAGALLPNILNGSLYKNPLHFGTPERIVVEYSQPNTHKALHVGHLRCLILGDAVCRILDAAGHNVLRTTYPGDMGAHIAKTLWFMKNHHKEQPPASHRGDWLGNLYATAHSFIEERSQDPTQAASIKTQIGAVLAELQSGSGAYFDLWRETREWSFAEMRSIYEWMGVTFDEWYTESECDGPSRELVLQKEREGLFVKDQGAIGIDLSEWKLGFALLLKSDGNGLYLTKDLELIRRKFSDPNVTRSIVVVDARQKLHFRQVFKIAELMGYPQAKVSAHLDYETVNTADGKAAFSSRTNNGMTLADLRSQMEAKVQSEYLERYRGIWTDAEIKRTASIVTVGAIKYGMLKVDNNTAVNFDINEWLRLDGDTGPYLQYVYARCRNILEKQANPATPPDPEASQAAVKEFLATGHQLVETIEQELLLALTRYFDALRQSAELLRPTFVATYLFELARTFNRFYEQCSIKESSGALRLSRLELVAATASVMAHGLDVLGIEAPERM